MFSQSQASSFSPATSVGGSGSFSSQSRAQPQASSLSNTMSHTHSNPASQQPSGTDTQQSGGVQQTFQSSGPTATAPFLEDFNLVAEAAKRAQIAVVMRDLESISLWHENSNPLIKIKKTSASFSASWRLYNSCNLFSWARLLLERVSDCAAKYTMPPCILWSRPEHAGRNMWIPGLIQYIITVS